MPSLTRLPVFLSYARTDNDSDNPAERWLDRLLEMLKPLALNDQVCAWSDNDIKAGENWQDIIDSQLGDFSKAAVLLVSPAFLASDFIRNGELPVLLKRHQEEGVAIIAVILPTCFFHEAEFNYPDPQDGPERVSLSVFQSVNSPKRPLSAMPVAEQDDVLMSIGNRLKELFECQ